MMSIDAAVVIVNEYHGRGICPWCREPRREDGRRLCVTCGAPRVEHAPEYAREALLILRSLGVGCWR
jgi:predicted amidophosphoribosyltransferase